jgi:hypothetical protein
MELFNLDCEKRGLYEGFIRGKINFILLKRTNYGSKPTSAISKRSAFGGTLIS